MDIRNSADLEHIFEQHEINAVMHFAGYKAVGESVQQPLRYYRGNLDSTLTLLE
ncbi:GDP-mannose 4,6-dehydratase, partial [Klebsiella pneumoniae]|uniref:GDP-mannose 4,6-dehydratase n=1 Tax=Klebsiella pneumoniae TaxID=573 RepID=UPI003C6DA893